MHFQDPSLLQFQERLKEERQRSNLGDDTCLYQDHYF